MYGKNVIVKNDIGKLNAIYTGIDIESSSILVWPV